jgi:hypothetical protein
MVVFSGILERPKPPPLGNVRGYIPAHCHGATFLGAFVDCCLFACCPGGR